MRHCESSPEFCVAGATVLLALHLLLAVGCERANAPKRLTERLDALDRPNLLLIVVDTLRADWTSPYGFEQDTTPELGRWAARGVLFERTLSQSSWTKMSMASLFTSLWPGTHGIRKPRDGLAPQAVTLAELIREAGYRTYAVQTNGWLDASFGFHQGFEHYVFPIGRGARGLPRASLWPHADRVYEEFLRLLDAHPDDAPFFLYLHFMDVHQYGAPAEFQTFGSGDRGHYLAAIRWVDDALRRIRESLDESGHGRDTVVLLTSDHGEEFGEHGATGHARNVFTTAVWVPLVIRLPFSVDPVRVPTQVRSIDVAPTLLDFAGVPRPAWFEGVSLLPLIADSTTGASPDRPSFAALGFPLFRDSVVQQSLNDGDWSYVRNAEPDPAQTEYLFDRRLDPEEQVNLVAREEQQAARLRSLLDEHRRKPGRDGVRNLDVRIDPAISKRLRAMGYLE